MGRQNYCQSSLAEELHLQQGILKKHSAKREALEASLIGREMEVLVLTAKNCATGEIADQLYVSKRTVEGHRQHIYQKTDCKNTLEIARLAEALGWIEPLNGLSDLGGISVG